MGSKPHFILHLSAPAGKGFFTFSFQFIQFSGTTAMELNGLPSKRMVEVAQ